MSGCPCCDAGSASDGKEPAVARASLSRRCANVSRWVVPGAILVLMPKCPMCLAAYVALGTGIALSASAATYLRSGLILLCVASLFYLVTRTAIRRVSR